MPGKLALKNYTPPEAPVQPVLDDLTATQKKKVKTRIRNVLAGKMLDEQRVVHQTVHACNNTDGVTVNAVMVRQVIAEMGQDGEFLPGHGSPIVAEPEPIEPE